MASDLKPPRNLRRVDPRCCNTCALGYFVDGVFECRRPGGPVWDAGDREFDYHVCDGWQSAWKAFISHARGD